VFFKKSSLVEPSRPVSQVEASLLPENVPVALDSFMAVMSEVLAEFETSLADLDVARAKWADICRDMSMNPLDPLELDVLTNHFDRGATERMVLVVVLLERGAIAKEMLARIVDRRLRSATKGGIVDPARESKLLTLALLAQSPLRREELARRVVLGFGASIRGEKLSESKAALERLDYGRLMDEADRARRAVRG